MGGQHIYGGMEGGGTKFVCAVGTGPEEIVAEIRYPTTTPDETLGKALDFFAKYDLAGIGLAPFGPLDLNPASPTFGSIAATPKPGWSWTNVLTAFRARFSIPLAFDLDVNAAAYGEYAWVPKNRSLDSLVYYTIGTGIGAGILLGGRLVHGLTHPEAGHVTLPHDRTADPFPGSCPFHGDCFEGLANGPALTARWGQPSDSLPDDHPAWALEAGYIAHALANVILTLSPQRIVLGGGVMKRAQLFPLIRQRVGEILNSYVASPVIAGGMDEFIVPPALGGRSGILGAMALARALSNPMSAS
jgi:fructokinase